MYVHTLYPSLPPSLPPSPFSPFSPFSSLPSPPLPPQHYCSIFSKVYDAEVKDFISDLKQRIAPKKGGSKLDESSFSLTVSALNVGRSVGSLPRSASKTSVGSGTGEEGENPTLFFQVRICACICRHADIWSRLSTPDVRNHPLKSK